MRPSPSPEHAVAGPAGAARPCLARVPLRQAAAAQAGAAVVVLALMGLMPAESNLDAMSWAVLQGIVAASLARAAQMDSWWIPIQAAFVPGLVWMLGLGLAPAYSLAAFCLLASLYWGVSGSRVPLFLSSRATARALANLLPKRRGFTFLDLGCGFGGVLDQLAGARPLGSYFGIESAPLPFLLSWLRAAVRGRSSRVYWGDFRELDLGRYDVVYAYLSPAAMAGLWQQARREMRPGTILISNGFAIPGVPPALTVAHGAHGEAKLLLWRL